MPDLKNTLSAALSEPRPTLVEFYADWCPHCRRMKPIVDELRQIVSNKVSIIQIEGDGNPGLMDQYRVNSYPTWLLFKNGQEVWRDGGEKPLGDLRDMIDRFV